MNEYLRLTQLLYSCWIVSDPGSGGKDTIPTSGGVLEYALRNAIDKGAFPEWAREELHFVNGETGLTCLELPFIEKLATEVKFTNDPNPSYTRTTVAVGKPFALRCLAKLGVPEEQAREWGAKLRESAALAEKQLSLVSTTPIGV